MEIKFYCPVCNRVEFGKTIDIQSVNGINQFVVCNSCGNMMNLQTINAIIKRLQQVSHKEMSIENMIYYPTKIDKDSHEYDMQPKSKR